MTKHELNQIYYLHKEIRLWEAEIEKLKNQSYVESPKLTEVPHGTQKSDRVGNTAIRIYSLEQSINQKLQEIKESKERITQYIMSIEDSQTRLIFKLRCIDLCSWAKIAHKIGGDNTPDGVRMIFNRYIKRYL